jgi:hypothetical protein
MISINLPSLQSAALQYYAQFIPPFQIFDKNRALTIALREINHRPSCRIATDSGAESSGEIAGLDIRHRHAILAEYGIV